MRIAGITLILCLFLCLPRMAQAGGVELYGNENAFGFGPYPVSPTEGATMIGLAPGAISGATYAFTHPYPFSPGPGDFPGTDQIYVGSVQTAFHDAYSREPQRLNGPDVLTLDYNSLVPADSTITSFTLGLALDDFQYPVWGDPFTVAVNGVPNASLTSLVNSINETGPIVYYETIGLAPSILSSSNVLTLSIDEGGDGGDGYALDFLTVGVTTVPLPSSLAMGLVGIGVLSVVVARRRKSAAA
jgi:hypothetical protein